MGDKAGPQENPRPARTRGIVARPKKESRSDEDREQSTTEIFDEEGAGIAAKE